MRGRWSASSAECTWSTTFSQAEGVMMSFLRSCCRSLAPQHFSSCFSSLTCTP